MMKSTLFIALFAVATVSVAQAPQFGKEARRARMDARAQEKFVAADKDGDGALTKEEAQAGMPRVASNFEKLDADKNGKVTSEELKGAGKAYGEARAQSKFSAADTNGDGALSKEEAETGMPQVATNFEKLDTNKDGKVTPEELKAGGKAKVDAKFTAADKDGDGALTKEEAQAGMPRIVKDFDKIDTDKNGKVTPQELEAAVNNRTQAK